MIDRSATTETEFLTQILAQQSYLAPWCWQNPYRDDGKELCDQAIVVNNSVVLFFDRRLESQDTVSGLQSDITKWRRWHRRTILKQQSSARRAIGYLRDKGRIFDTAKCDHDISTWDTNEGPEVHIIITGHDTGFRWFESRFADDFERMGLNVPFRPPQIVGDHPTVRYVRKANQTVSLFEIELRKGLPVIYADIVSLIVIFSTLDTVTDLLAYLKTKNSYVQNQETYTQKGEESELSKYLARYIQGTGQFTFKHADPKIEQRAAAVGATWNDFVCEREYHEWRNARAKSQWWDSLIRTITSGKTLTENAAIRSQVSRMGIAREMTLEPRIQRQYLTHQFTTKNIKIRQGKVGLTGIDSRSFPSAQFGLAYAYIHMKNVPRESDEERNFKEMQCFIHTSVGLLRYKIGINRVVCLIFNWPTGETANLSGAFYADKSTLTCKHIAVAELWDKLDPTVWQRMQSGWQLS